MKILNAVYGVPGQYIDITANLQSRIKNNKLFVIVNNSLAPDPAVGYVKHLSITVRTDENQINNYNFAENTVCILPKTSNSKLGIFYSNNYDSTIYPAITASLKSIEKAAFGRADIVTCMWHKHPENPFVELISWTHSSSHLNQILQILQCLYTAGQVQEYKYVSFLEHDVLYNEFYFDYEDFDSGILSNMNYIGLNRNGWQSTNQFDRPLSQLTMLFQDAVDHFNSILKNALIRNSGNLEPYYNMHNLKIKDWHCKEPNVHINHGRHFTSHFSVYSQSTVPIHSYWGNYQNYSNLFNF
jgi:hypothetical protein